MIGISLPVVAATSGSVGMSVTVDVGPPASITDLGATPGKLIGDIELAWTTPGDDGWNGQLTGYPYTVKYDTRSVAELGGTTTSWWEQAAYTYVQGWAALAPTVWDNTHWLAGLTAGTTYYIAIRAIDKVGNEALNNNVASAMPREDTTPPAAVTDLSAETWTGQGEIQLTWTAPGDDGWNNPISGGKYGVKWSTYSSFDWDGPSNFDLEWATSTSPGIAEIKVITGLTGGTTYYFRIWTRDEVPTNWSDLSNGATAWAQVVSLAPESPTGLVAEAGNRKVTLTWTPNTEPDMKSYWVYRSTSSGSYNYGIALAAVTHPTAKYVDTGLTNEITYYYVVKAVNEAGYASEPSYEVSARPSLKPREPCGVKGTIVDGGKNVKIEWKGVTRNEDGSECVDLGGYNLYRSVSYSEFSSEPTASVEKSVLLWKDTGVAGKTYYYKVRAVDTGDVESGDSMVIMVQDGKVNVIVLAEDMQAKLLIPDDLTDILYKESSSYGVDLNITISSSTLGNRDDKVISCYEFSAFKDYGNETPQKIESFSFDKPKASVSLSYEVDSQGLVKGTSIKASQAGRELALFWFNGIEWVKLGARTDTVEQVLVIKTKKLGKYKIKESFAATEFTLNKVYPRIFTPNNDGLNDVVNFEYANPNEKGVVCRIFDIRGALVRQLDIGQTETSFAWDGKDEKGRVAPSGVYIYQLEGEGKVINGTVILAK